MIVPVTVLGSFPQTGSVCCTPLPPGVAPEWQELLERKVPERIAE